MSVARLKTWVSEVLFPADLNNEFNNLITNGTDVAFPLTHTVEGGGFAINSLSGISVTSSVIYGNAAVHPTIAGQMLRNGTIMEVFDGSIARINQCLQVASQSGVVSTSATEELLYAISIPAGALGTKNKVVSKIMFRVGLLNNATCDIICYYGADQGASIGIGNISGSTVGLTLVPLTITLSANNATNAQVMTIEGQLTNTTSTTVNTFGAVNSNLAQVGACAIDSTAAATLQINVLFSASDAANQCDYAGLHTMLIG